MTDRFKKSFHHFWFVQLFTHFDFDPNFHLLIWLDYILNIHLFYH